jgi:hypothetical protein
MRFSYTVNPAFSESEHQFTIAHFGGNRPIDEVNRLYEDAKDWCTEMFPEKRIIRFYYSGWTIWIVKQDDAFAFRMRWC